MKFKIYVNGVIEADNVDNAIWKVGRHFLDVAEGIESPSEFVGSINVKPMKG